MFFSRCHRDSKLLDESQNREEEQKDECSVEKLVRKSLHH